MRVGSLTSPVTIVLGTIFLHVALATLALFVEEPDQEKMDELIAQYVEPGEPQCVSSSELSSALSSAMTMHITIFVVLLYIRVHTSLWTPFVQRCRREQMCCYKEFKRKIVDDDEFDNVKLYNNDLKTKL